jgi:phospholipase/lecithinase/hemolysin
MTLLIVQPVRADQITGIVSFGDSLSDAGNFYAATGQVSPPALQGYAAGEFTNGWNWVQYLAQDLGVALPTASVNGGTDYAAGGAMTGPGTTLGAFWDASFNPVTATVPNMDQQIANYLGSHTPTSNQLYTLWGGANDLLHQSSPDPIASADNIANEINTLAKAGATQFIVGNLPLLGELPYIRMFQPSASQALDYLSSVFNGRLEADLVTLQGQLSVQIHVLDISSLAADAEANPTKYGLTNGTDAALFQGSNGQGYLYWDGLHPTTQGDQIIAALAAQSVPEPSSVVLLATALIVVGTWASPKTSVIRSSSYVQFT